MNNMDIKHIVALPGIPDDMAYIPWLTSGDTALLINLTRIVRVCVDNSVVDPEYVKERGLEDSVIVGTNTACSLGIDIDEGGDAVYVISSEDVVSLNMNDDGTPSFVSVTKKIEETIKELRDAGTQIVKINVTIETLPSDKPLQTTGELIVEVVEGEGLSVNREKYINIGGKVAVEHSANFDKYNISVLKPEGDKKVYDSMHFGMYQCFTVMSQHIYGRKNDILFILGVMASSQVNGDNGLQTKVFAFNKLMEYSDDYEKRAEAATIAEAKRMANIVGVKISDEFETSKDIVEAMETSGWFLPGNYFWAYKRGQKLLYTCEDVSKFLDHVVNKD